MGKVPSRQSGIKLSQKEVFGDLGPTQDSGSHFGKYFVSRKTSSSLNNPACMSEVTVNDYGELEVLLI